jgi:UDPglucose 6-dehydrogenase
VATKDNKVCVIGIWHLGTVVSACLSDLGYLVVGWDKDAKKIEHLNRGVPPLFESGLEELLRKGIQSKRLSYTTDLSQAAKGSSFVLITFDTPVDEKDEVDLSEILTTAQELGKCLGNGATVIVSSQVPVGTCEQIKALIKQNNPSLDFDVACSPENLRLGKAIEMFKHPDRVVIGADSTATLDKVARFFDVVSGAKVKMDLRSAEMTKHAINAFLATSISFANEIGNLCDEVGADAIKVAEALGLEERIGQKLPLKPGLAFAGGTLARDMKILQHLGDKSDCETYLIDGVLKVNEQQKKIVTRKLEKIYGSIRNLTVGILGLTYKAGTSSLRRSVALEIIKDLTNGGATVKAYDPKADLEEVKLHQEFELGTDPYTVARDGDALVIVTDWPEFKELDFDLIKSIMKRPVLVDAKNMLDKEQLISKGFLYSGIGRGTDYGLKR